MELVFELEGDHGFVGTAKLSMLSPIDRLGLLKESNVKIDSKGVADTKEIDLISMMPMMYRVVKERVLECHFKYEGRDFKDLEELSFYDEAAPVFMELGTRLMQGPSLGKTSKRTSGKPAK